MFYVYIIYSELLQKYYIGQTQKLVVRLEQHNAGMNKATKSGKPWELKFRKDFQSRSEAVVYERELKNKKSRNYIEWLISQTV